MGNQTTFKKGEGGRKKGSVNKFTSLRESFLHVYQMLGGDAALHAWAQKCDHNRAAFYQMITRLLPQEMQHSGDVKTDGHLTVEVVHVKGADVPGGNGGNGGNGDK